LCFKIDNTSLDIPVNCPEKETIKKFEIVSDTDDDVILDIRKKYRRK